MKNEKPLGIKNYGSIPHLSGSRVCPEGEMEKGEVLRILNSYAVCDNQDRVVIPEDRFAAIADKLVDSRTYDKYFRLQDQTKA